jgi:magnesium-transporting ATPase (P-type)
MSVLCKTLGSSNSIEVYSKGAPEKIKTLCKPETIPNDFDSVLQKYTVNGFRVIALAGKTLNMNLIDACKLQRDSIESDLSFYGLLIMQNMIKPVTPIIINELIKADITSVMVTGDNLLTAINVSKNCCIIPHNDKIILVEAHPPNYDSQVPARIEWKLVKNVEDFDTCSASSIRHDRVSVLS